MKKLLLLVVPLLVILGALPIIGAVVVTMSGQAAAECRTDTVPSGPADLGGTLSVSDGLGDLGVIEGPTGGPVNGVITVSQANIPNRSGLGGFRSSMPRVLAHDPDFVTLNEISGRSTVEIGGAAPGYDVFRAAPTAGRGAAEAMSNAVLWERSTWTKVNAGQVKIVADDQLYYQGQPRTWDRYATWVMLQRTSDGAVVSVIATHHMTNPRRFPRQHGTPVLTRAQQYGAGMNVLLQLQASLATHGPVLLGGDMNTHGSYANLPWSAVAKMKGAGYDWANHSVDFVFYPHRQGARLAASWTGPMTSDHQWVSARIRMNGIGPTAPGTSTSGSASNAAVNAATSTVSTSSAARAAAPAVAAGRPARRGSAAAAEGDVMPALMRLRFSAAYPTLSAEQARNAVVIAQVARDLGVSRYGLEVAIATAIQESKLVNLDGGDRDSGGLFQQRPSTGWGSRAQVTNPTLAATAFFGRAQHTNNPGLLDIPGWEQMAVTDAAQAVQRSGFPGAYAQWKGTARDIAALLGADLPQITDPTAGISNASNAGCPDTATGAGSVAPVTLGTLNLLGADHTNGGQQRPGFGGWQTRLPGAMSALEDAGVTIAALQEVHPPQANVLASRYSAQWGMYPAAGGAQNRVIWDRNEWTATAQRLVDIPYFGGKNVGMPLVQLTSTTTGQAIWVWSIHNPANVHGPAAGHRAEALRRQLSTLTALAASGAPTVVMGDFNDDKDGESSSHCVLTPTLTNAFGGSSTPCRKPKADSRLDHIYGANLTWTDARVDNSTRARKFSDHPLVVATTAGSSAGCAVPTDTDYHLGQVTPQLTAMVNVLAPMFDIKTVGGYRASATDPHGHPAGLAADFMVPINPAGRAQGQALATYAQRNASRLGIDYIIWYQKIWSTSRVSEGWRPMEDRGGATQNHLDHVHINVKPGAQAAAITTTGAGSSSDGSVAGCSEIVYPVPAAHVGSDRHNWHDQGGSWSTWHTGTDFSAPCGTAVYAAHAGTVEIDTSQGWAGPALVKVTAGPKALTTWYAHMEKVTVSRGAQVQPGQQIGMVGNEGNSRGCHLHFEVHLKNGSIYGADNVNPSDWLTTNATAPRAAKAA